MKRKIFGAALIAAMALAAGWNFNQSKKEVELADLTVANMEALAHNEGTGVHNHGPTGNPLFGSKYCKNQNQVDCNY